MRRLIALTTFVLAVPAMAAAHVGVRPRESRAGAEELYTVRVPTEGAVATTSVRFEIPVDVTVLDVPQPEAGSVETKRADGRIVEIVWTREIKPRESAEFTFRAKNPSSGESIMWKARQMFSDGTSADWVNAPGAGGRPGPVTKLLPAGALTPAAPHAQHESEQHGAAHQRPTHTADHARHAPVSPAEHAARHGEAGASGQTAADATAIEKWLDGYDAAFIAKDLDTLATYYHPNVTIYEGGGIDNGWIDYRDTHLGPELKAFENLQFGHTNRKVQILSPNSAYVTSLYFIKAKMGERTLDSGGLETLVLIKGADGAWKIRHTHTSARARRPAGGGL